MGDESDEVPRQWFDGELRKEFKLPKISSPWLTEVFQIWNDKFDAAEASHPTADFQTGRGLHVPLVKSSDPDSEVGKKGVAPTPVADLSPAQRHSQSSSEQQGISSSSVDSSMWDEASAAQAPVVSSCFAVQGHLNDYERGINREGYGQKEVGART